MTDHTDRIERARQVVQGQVLALDEIEAIVTAYLGDDDVYVSDMPEDFVTALAPGQSIAWLVDSGYLVLLNREDTE